MVKNNIELDVKTKCIEQGKTQVQIAEEIDTTKAYVNRVIKKKTIFIGSLNMSIVTPREVFKEAIGVSSAKMILLHNHPSGDPTPSREDILLTERIRQAGELIGIELLDHIVMGDNCYISFSEQELLRVKGQ